MMCGRAHFIYDQISNFAIALYVMGLLNAEDIMALNDVDAEEAAEILAAHFTPIRERDLPVDYRIEDSTQRYLLVIGDPLFPMHFAVFTDAQSPRPYFSKLRYYGSGFDGFEDLLSDFIGEDGLSRKDIRFFQLKPRPAASKGLPPQIYIVRDDGGYRVI